MIYLAATDVTVSYIHPVQFPRRHKYQGELMRLEYIYIVVLCTSMVRLHSFRYIYC